MDECKRERTERVLADRTRFILSDDEWTGFYEALERPATVLVGIADLLDRPLPHDVRAAMRAKRAP